MRQLVLPFSLAAKLFIPQLRQKIRPSCLRCPLPFPFAKSFTCQAAAVDSETLHLTSLAFAASNSPPDRASIINELTALGLEVKIIDSLARLPSESFLEQWEKIQLLFRTGASPEQARALLSRSRISLSRFLGMPYEKLVTVAQLFEGFDLDRRTIGAVLTQSAVIRSPVETLQSRLKFFQSIGMEQGLFRCLLRRPSWILAMRTSCLEKRLDRFKEIGLNAKEVQRAFCRYPRVLSYDFDKCIIPKLEYLKSIGFCEKAILKFLIRSPGIVGISVEVISKKVELLKRLGIANSSEALFRGLIYLISFRCETIQARFDWFRSKGFSFEEVGVLGRFPVAFQKSEKDLERRFDYLEKILERDKKEVVVAPVYLSYSFESRIVVRFNTLREKGLLKTNIPLTAVLCPTNGAFASMIADRKFQNF